MKRTHKVKEIGQLQRFKEENVRLKKQVVRLRKQVDQGVSTVQDIQEVETNDTPDKTNNKSCPYCQRVGTKIFVTPGGKSITFCAHCHKEP